MKVNQNLNGRIVRRNGGIWRLTVAMLGGIALIDAECIFGNEKGTVVNLQKSRSPLAQALRGSINLNLVS